MVCAHDTRRDRGAGRPQRGWAIPVGLLMMGLIGGWGGAPADGQVISTQPVRSSMADGDYYVATQQFNEGKWPMAAELYREFLKKYAGHARAADAQFGLAESLFQMKRYKEAAAGFAIVLARYPNFDKLAETQFEIGQCHLSGDEPEQAAAAFARVAERYKGHHLVELADAKQAECLINLRRYEQAEQLFEPLASQYITGPKAAENLAARKRELAAINPRLPDPFELVMVRAQWNLSLARYALRNYEASAAGFAFFAERNPSHDLAESARFYLAKSLYGQGKFAEAAAAFEQLAKGKGPMAASAAYERALAIYKAGEFKKAAIAFTDMAEAFPADEQAAAALLYAGTSLYQANEFDAAVRHFERIIRNKSAPLADEGLYWKALAQLKLNRPAEAFQTLAEAIKAQPASKRLADMQLAQADALLAQNKLSEAAVIYQVYANQAAKGPAASRALYLAAFALHRAGRHADSAVLCTRYLAAYPADPLVFQVLQIAAENQFALKDYPAGEKYYRELIDRNNDKNIDANHALLRLAWLLYFQQRHEDALVSLDRMAKPADPAGDPAQYLRANCLFELKRDNEAARALAAYLGPAGKVDNADDVLIKLAQVQVRQERRPEAIKTLERLIADHPNSPVRAQAEYELAESCYVQKQFAGALEHYQEALKRDPKGPMAGYASFGAGLCHYDQERWREAAEAFAAVAQDFAHNDALLSQALYRRGLSLQKMDLWAAAEAPLGQLVERLPKDDYAPAALKAVGLGREKQEKYDKAIETFTRLLKLYPQCRDQDQIHYEIAWCNQKLNRKDAMLAAYQSLIAEFPDSPLAGDAYFYLAEEQYQAKDYPAALTLYAKALSVGGAATQPDGGEGGSAERLRDKITYRIGLSRWAQGKLPEAAEQFDALARNFPASKLWPNALLNAAEAYLKINRPSIAVDRLNTLIAANPAQFDRMDKAYLRLGQAHLLLGKADLALKSLLTMREKFPNYEALPEVDCSIGQALYEMKRYDDAVRALNLTIDSASPQATDEVLAKAQYYVGQCHLAANRPLDAIKSFLKVSFLYRDYPEWAAASLLELAKLYLRQEQKKEALESLQAVVEKYPNTPWAETAKAQLKAVAP